MAEYDPKLVERMAEAMRELARVNPDDVGRYFAFNWVDRAQKMVAELPAPVDPDLLLAREVVRDQYGNPDTQWAHKLHAGKHDDSDAVRVALAAIKRVRSEQADG